MLRGLIFDLDGVITDTAEFHFQAWQVLAEDLGVALTREFNENLKGVSRGESLNRILALGQLEDAFSEQEKEALAAKKNDYYLTLIEQITPKDLLPGIPSLLQDAKREDMRIALASASKNGPVILEKLQIEHFFDAIVDPAALQHGKPHPEIFEQARRKLDLRTTEVVGIEDAYSGIQSINGAGIFSIGVGSTDSMKEADFVVADTAELTLELIKEVFPFKLAS